MKTTYAFIIILFFTSCFTSRQTKTVKAPKPDILKDVTKSPKVIIESNDVAVDSIIEVHNKINVGSGWEGSESEIVLSSSPIPKGINITEIKNSKVISPSKELSEGRVVYKIPTLMKVRSTYQVILRIAKSKSTLSIYDSLKEEVTTSVIPVTQTM